jgi:WD40 repeat protein
MPTFRSDGKSITGPSYDGRLYEYDSTNITSVMRYTEKSNFIVTSVADCPLEPGLLIVGRDNGQLDIVSYPDVKNSKFKLHCKLTPVGSVRFSACAWSQDRKWIATGDDVGDIRLWNAGVTTSIYLVRILPRLQSSPVTSVIFVPDGTAIL